ncbi:MAG: dependent oxidoreductase, partial [Firmicutes bacterium]|nr:dependent oxidoreductase [Bacillota bacterium]
HKLCFVPGNKLEDLIDFSYRVIRSRFSDEFMLMNGSYLASILGKTPAEIKLLRAVLPTWIALIGIAGRELLPDERVAAQEADIAELAQQFGLYLKPALAGIKGDAVLAAITNPAGETDWKDTFKGAYQDIFFTTTLDKTPAMIEAMNQFTVTAGYPVDEVGIYLQPQNMGTSSHCEFYLPYDSANAKETSRVKGLFEKASEGLSAKGAYFLRPYGIWSKIQLNRDAQSMLVLKELKKTFDPNGIMNTGKLSNY